MGVLMGFYETVGWLLSRERIRSTERTLRNAGITAPAESFVGFLLVVNILLTLVVFFLGLHYQVLPSFLLSVLGPTVFLPEWANIIFTFVLALAAVFLASATLVWVLLLLQIEARRMAVEAVLPDFLGLMSGNVRSGMTIDQAMWYAAKPEFGILSIEIRNVIKSAFSGEPFEKALDRLSARFNSKILRRTILLIKQAMATGGEVAEILEITAEDAREVAIQKKDISSTLLIYIIFLIFAAAVGTPFLFAVSNKLIGVLFVAFSYMPAGAPVEGNVPYTFFVQPSAPLITTEEFFWFSVATLFLTCLISSLLLGVIQAGSKMQGLKYFPFMLVLAYIIYFVVSSVLESYFASMLI